MTGIVRFLVSLCILGSTAGPVLAQNETRLLLPLTPGRVPGAHGSEWHTDIVISNMSNTPLLVTGYRSDTHCPGCTEPPPIAAKASVIVSQTSQCETRGTYLFVDQGRINDIAATLRSRDISRQAETWGTNIPVVSSEDLYSTTIGISDVPMEQQFRSILRVYNVDPGGAGAVVVRFYAMNTIRVWPTFPNSDPDPLLLEVLPPFTVPVTGGGTAACPSFFEMPLDTRPELLGVERLRIEIEPLDLRRTYWAFVSTTHNQTQHVTIVVPR